MNVPSNSNWNPDPQLLAAFLDGELEGRPEMSDLRARIEAWLETHPQAMGELEDQRALKELWQETTPAEPSAAAWSKTLERIEARRQHPRRVAGRSWFALNVFAASVALALIAALVAWRLSLPTENEKSPIAVQPPVKQKLPDEPIEVFEVATADEVVVLSIGGADTAALVVGLLPLMGAIELAEPSEVCIFTQCPRTNMRQNGHDRPMIWPRSDAD